MAAEIRIAARTAEFNATGIVNGVTKTDFGSPIQPMKPRSAVFGVIISN